MSALEKEIAALRRRYAELEEKIATSGDRDARAAAGEAAGVIENELQMLGRLHVRELAGETISQAQIDGALGRAKPVEKPKPAQRTVWTDAALNKLVGQINETFPIIKQYVDDLQKEVEGVVLAIGKRLKALESRPTFEDAGIWVHDKTYRLGNGVSESGSFWIAKRDTTFGEKPGSSDAWRLAVKRGKDGRDAR